MPWILEWVGDLSHRLATEPIKVRFAFYTGVAALAAATLAGLWTIGLRLVYANAHQRRKDLRRRWTDILLDALDGDVSELPKLPKRDRRTVIGRFNYLFETLTGDAHQQLRWLAFAGRLDKTALEMIDDRNAAESLTGIVAAGHLHLAQAVQPLLATLHDPRPAHSLASAQALMRIDKDVALTPVVEEFGRRGDWHVTRVADVLEHAGREMGARLGHLLEDPSATAPDKIRIIETIEAINDPLGMEAIRRLLVETAESGRENRRVVACALRAIATGQDPRDAVLVARFYQHPDAAVRRETAAALGKVGDTDQAPELMALLADPNSWVRFEAARALLALPNMDEQRRDDTLRAITDPTARLSFMRAIAEKR